MKRIKKYTDNLLDTLLKETGSFWAFGQKQFKEQAKEGIKYVSANNGLIIPKSNYDEFKIKLSYIIKDSIDKDLKDNGKTTIIVRELEAHECFETHDIDECVDYLKQYNIERDEVQEIFNQK